MKRSIGTWQMIGFIFTAAAGTLLHFLYDWTGGNPVVGLFSAVNESIWEHTKLLFVPMVIFALAEYALIGKDVPNFWCVKALGAAVGIGVIPVIYYTYTGILGTSADWFNIAIFFIAAAVTYWLETKLMTKDGPRCRMPGVVFLAALALLYVIFTFRPLPIPLFRPPQ